MRIDSEAVLTLPVDREALSQADAPGLSAAPHFFQVKIEKAFELRVQATRDRVRAFRIDSQSEPAAQTDWRVAASALSFEPFELPMAIADALQRYLERAGYYFGAFDLIVEPEGGYIFLECNMNGQWWWLQDRSRIDIAGDVAKAILRAQQDFSSCEDE